MFLEVLHPAFRRLCVFVMRPLFCIFVPPRLPFPALHFSSQAPRRFSPAVGNCNILCRSRSDIVSSRRLWCFFNINPKSQALLQFFLTTLFPPLLIPSAPSAYFLSQSLQRRCFSPVSSPVQPSVCLSYMKVSDRRRFSLFQGLFSPSLSPSHVSRKRRKPGSV